MKYIILMLFVFTGFQKCTDPTGTYELESKTIEKDGEMYGYSGEVKVKKLDSNRIAVDFFVTKGAPGYNFGSFVDTLKYENNKAVYTPAEYDPSCSITFEFGTEGIKVTQEANDLNMACGFGHGVYANGFYKKISNETPVIEAEP